MEIYTIRRLNENELILEKIQNDFMDEYDREILPNGNISLKKRQSTIISSFNDFNNEIKKYNIKYSEIIKCTINKTKTNLYKYKQNLDYIYNIIDRGSQIIKHTTLHIETVHKTNDGFKYYPDLGISVQSVNSNKCLKEIITQCFYNDIRINITIKTSENDIIEISI